MSREERRRFEREFRKLSKGDNCTICGKPFPHNSRTFAGLAADGTTALAGECCSGRIATVMVSGLYLTQGIDLLTTAGKPGARKAGAAPADVDQALTEMQALFDEVDAHANAVMKQAGIHRPARGICLGEHPWKADDAAWFKSHPERSHRMRPLLEGEAAAAGVPIPKGAIPANHRVEILVRQVEPGKRIRTSFCRNIAIDIPDQEEIIHAIFDAVASAREGQVIDLGETIARARQYANSRAQRLN